MALHYTSEKEQLCETYSEEDEPVEIQWKEADSLGWATASTTLLSLKSLCGGGVPSSHPSLGLSVFFLSFFTGHG